MDSGDAARSLFTLRVDRRTYEASSHRDGDCRLLCAFSSEHGLHRLGSRRAVRWTIHPGARHTSQSAYRAQIWSTVARIGDRKITRADRSHPRLLGLLATWEQTKVSR